MEINNSTIFFYLYIQHSTLQHIATWHTWTISERQTKMTMTLTVFLVCICWQGELRIVCDIERSRGALAEWQVGPLTFLFSRDISNNGNFSTRPGCPVRL